MKINENGKEGRPHHKHCKVNNWKKSSHIVLKHISTLFLRISKKIKKINILRFNPLKAKSIHNFFPRAIII
jgi:hypothetical protein